MNQTFQCYLHETTYTLNQTVEHLSFSVSSLHIFSYSKKLQELPIHLYLSRTSKVGTIHATLRILFFLIMYKQGSLFVKVGSGLLTTAAAWNMIELLLYSDFQLILISREKSYRRIEVFSLSLSLLFFYTFSISFLITDML